MKLFKTNTKPRRLLLILLIGSMIPASAYDFKVNGLCYNKNSNGTSVSVTNDEEEGIYATFCDINSPVDLIIPSSVNYRGVNYTVTAIDNAFMYCSGLTSVTIPNTVTAIGDDAFYRSGLTSVTIPNSVTAIGPHAFRNCSDLTSIEVAQGNPKYDSRDNCNAIVETASNTLITGCKNTIIPNSITAIGGDAFFECSGLTSVIIPNSVISIGGGAFCNCTGLTSVTIPNSVTSISPDSFGRSRNVFQGCSSLTSIEVAQGNPKFDSRNNCNAIIQTNIKRLITGCKNTTIPNSVTAIGEGAFNGCSGLTSVTIPNSVTNIDSEAFAYCRGMTSVTIPNSVTHIAQWAFRDCGGLSTIYAFPDPSKVSIPTYDYISPFLAVNMNSCVLYVPEAYLNAYKTTNIWKDFRNIYPYISVSSVTLNKDRTTIYIDGTEKITANVLPDNADLKFLNWSSNDSTVATVDQNGLITAKKLGTAVITATATDGSGMNVSASCEVTVTGITNISLNKTSASLHAGCTEQLSATITPSDVINKTLYWTTNDSTVATVDQNGLITAKKLGTAVITATATDGSGVSASCEVTVIEITGISLNKTSTSIYVNGIEQLSATITPSDVINKTLYWSTNDSTVADVDQNGLITAKKLGSAVITATATDGSGVSASCEVTVTGITNIALNMTTTTINVGGIKQLAATITPEDVIVKELIWSSSDESVATVDQNGTVSAIKPGKASITATTTDGTELSDSCMVIVVRLVTGISLSESSHTLKYDNGKNTYSFQLTATITPENATNRIFAWTTTDESVAVVDSTGSVTSTGKGVATITATTTDGTALSDSCVVTVEQLVTELTLEPTEKTTNVGESFTIATTLLPETANDKSLTWLSSDESVATVNSTGIVTALKRGAAVITATTNDGSDLNASCNVTILQPVTNISLSENNHTLKYNGQSTNSFTLNANVIPENATNKELVWTSSDPTVAIVREMKAYDYDITKIPNEVMYLNGEIFAYFVKPISWASSINVWAWDANNNNEQLSGVNNWPGASIGNKIGTDNDGLDVYLWKLDQAAFPGRVPTHIIFNDGSRQTEDLVFVNGGYYAASGMLAIMESGGQQGVQVVSAGLGTATITATTTDGTNLSASCEVTVEPVRTTSFSIDKSKESVIMGNSVQITGTVDDEATIKTFNWTSSDEAVASVDGNGLVRGVGAGTALITATTIDGTNMSAECIIQVLYPSEAAGAGDVNEDGRIDITDATLIVSYLQNGYPPISVLDESLMDVNGDGDINMSDWLRVISLIRND